MAKKDSQTKAKADLLIEDLKDPNSNADVPEDLVGKASRSSVLYKAGMPGMPKMPKASTSVKPLANPTQPMKPEGLVPPGTQAAMTAGKQNQVKGPMQKSSSKKLKKADNPDSKADEELAENVEALVNNHNKFNKEAEKKEARDMAKSEIELFLQKCEQMLKNGHELAALTLAEAVLSKTEESSEEYLKAKEIKESIPAKEEYTPFDTAVATLAKAEVMAKSHFFKEECESEAKEQAEESQEEKPKSKIADLIKKSSLAKAKFEEGLSDDKKVEIRGERNYRTGVERRTGKKFDAHENPGKFGQEVKGEPHKTQPHKIRKCEIAKIIKTRKAKK